MKTKVDLTDEEKLLISYAADDCLNARTGTTLGHIAHFGKRMQVDAVNRALAGELKTNWGDTVRQLVCERLGVVL